MDIQIITPQICRIVIYHDPGTNFEACGPGSIKPPRDVPAIIQLVNNDWTISIGVFSPDYGFYTRPSVPNGTGPDQWEWPHHIAAVAVAWIEKLDAEQEVVKL